MYIYTTHVGSFPLNYSEEAVRKIILDLSNLGINFLGYPQLRDFVEMYLEPLIQAGAISKIKVGFRVADEKTLRKEVIDEALVVREAKLLKEMHSSEIIKALGLKGSITGPFTLASNIYTAGRYDISSSLLKNKRVLRDVLGSLVTSYVKGLEKLNYNMVVIDEPILSVIVGRRILLGYSEKDIVELLNEILGEVKVKYRGIHVCGRLSPLLARILLKLDLEVLDHEHKTAPANFSVYSKEDLESNEKFLALGVVSSKEPKVESIEEIKTLIKKGIDLYGDRLLFVKPDCGFRGLRVPGREEEMYDISLRKLSNIITALKELGLLYV